MAAHKLQRSHAALKGIDPRNGFLSDETLLQFVGGDAFTYIIKKHQNERLRAFRDQYREFDQKIAKTKEANSKHIEKRRKLLNEWFQTLKNYFGYSDFVHESIPHWDGEGFLSYLRSPNSSHSVAILFAGEDEIPLDVDSSGFHLTTATGERTHQPNKKETLSEQVERLIKAAGCAEAVLFLPHSAYYFRSESQTAGQYLEIRWTEILLDDNDSALSLATHLLSSDFFAYSCSEEQAVAEDENEAAEEESEENEEEASGAAVKTKATASSMLFREDLEQARKITEDLHKQVTLALEILINERLNVDPALKQKSKNQNQNERIAHQLFKDGLFVLYRVLFILYAEARRFLPVENPQYASFYSVEHLRNWAEDFIKRERQGHADPDGTYLWGAFESLFTLLRRGVKLSGGEFVSAFNGQLFAPDQAPTFDEGPALRDNAIAQVLLTLTRVGGEESGRRLHFGNLGVEQLGAVYEALLAQKPVIVREESLWVPAHGGGVGLVSRKLADALEMTEFESTEMSGLRTTRKKRKRGAAVGRLETYISQERPGFNPTTGTFIVAPLGGQKRQTASFYTPPKLAEFLVKRTLKPLVEGKSAKDILNLRIVEPAVGSGGFLIATLRYLGQELLKAKVREKDITLRGRDTTFDDLQECKRQILENCLFGVDLNPLSLELCRTSLYLEALVKGQPLPFLHHRLKSGNSLIYADYLNQSKTSWDGHTEFPSIFNIFTEALDIDKKIFEAWDVKEKAFRRKATSNDIKEQISELKSKLRNERQTFGDENWADWAIKMQIELSKMLQLARKAVTEFEKIQKRGEIVDSLELRHRDRLAWIPELDDVLIEAEGIEIDTRLEAARKEVLINEHGPTGYKKMVRYQRAFARLKALGDLWCAQWFWPVDEMKCFPTLSILKELTEYLLDNNTLERTSKKKKRTLSKSAFQSLKAAFKVSREHRFYQWHIEFAQVFASPKHSGFSAIISNPPWGVVGVQDKDVYPIYDPQYLSLKAAEKPQRRKGLIKIEPNCEVEIFTKNRSAKGLTTLWQSTKKIEAKIEGKIDLSVLFSILSYCQINHEGRLGLLVTRYAIFSNSGTKDLRRLLIRERLLRESVNFRNTHSIFEIPSYFEFTCNVIAREAGTSNPIFVNNVVQTNDLDTISVAIDSRNPIATYFPVELSFEQLQKFSAATLAIPALISNTQVSVAAAIHNASGPVAYLSELERVVRQGINHSSGPKKGYCEFTNKIEPRELEKENGNWIPMLRGRDINHLLTSTDSPIEYYAKREHLSTRGINIERPKIAWRSLTRSGNQRTFMVSILPKGYYINGKAYALDVPKNLLSLAVILSSLPLDFLAKLTCGNGMTEEAVSCLPIANYKSMFLVKAVRIIEKTTISDADRARVDALIWHHYGINQPEMGRENLIWILENQFDTLKRNSPEYVDMIIKFYDEYSKDKSLRQIDHTPIFKLKDDSNQNTEVQNTSRSSSKKRSA